MERNTYFLPNYASLFLTPTPPLSTCEYAPDCALCSHVIGLDGVPFHPHLLVGRNFAFRRGCGCCWCGVLFGYVSYNTIAKTQPRNSTPLPLSPWHNKIAMTSPCLFGQPMPILLHPSIGHELPYWPMRGDRHGLAKMTAERHRREQ